MTHPNGTVGETRLVNYAREHGFGQADRLTKTGSHDRGDVTLCPGLMVEVKHVKVAGRYGPATELLADWMAQTREEVRNGKWELGFLVVKREGTNDVGRWFAYIEAGSLAAMVSQQGTAFVDRGHWEIARRPVCLPVKDLLHILRFAGWGDPL